MKSSESQEMYLETILLLTKKQANVRAVDICNERNLAKSSVSKALGILVKKDLISVNEQGYITLTENGKKVANDVYLKHNIITKVLIKMGVNEESAEENACRIEHVITDDLFEALKNFAQKN